MVVTGGSVESWYVRLLQNGWLLERSISYQSV